MSKSNQIPVPVPSSRPRHALALVHSDGQPLTRHPSADPDVVWVRCLAQILNVSLAEARDTLADLDRPLEPSTPAPRVSMTPLRLVPDPLPVPEPACEPEAEAEL